MPRYTKTAGGAIVLAGALCCALPALAQAANDSNTLTGGWGGVRQRLVNRGVDLNLYYTGNLAHNLTGGDRLSTAYASGFEFVGVFNFDKLFGWKGGSFHLDVANFDGTLLDDKAHLGSLLSTEQIFAGHATYVANFYLQQSLWNGFLRLRYGRMDLVSNFYTTPIITQFQNSTFFGPQPGLMSPDVTVWPTSSVGVAASVRLAKGWRFTLANLAVQPNNLVPSQALKPWNRGHRVGNVTMAQVRVKTAFPLANGRAPLHGLWMLGGWHNSAPQPDLFLGANGLPDVEPGETPLIRGSAGGLYLTGQQEITRNAAGGGFMVFADLLRADSNVTLINQMESVGVVYNAPFPSRPNDSIGFAIGRNGVGRQAAELARMEHGARRGSRFVPGSEYVAELNYVVQFPHGISVMPNLQYVDHPGGLAADHNFTVFGTQFNITF